MTAHDDKPGCIDPVLGDAASRQLGQPLDEPIAAHVEACLACRLERLAFADLAAHAVTPSLAFQARLGWALRAATEQDAP